MSTDIHIPRPVSEAAEKLAQRLGISKSELYTAAITAYMARNAEQYVTELLDAVYETESSHMEPEWVTVQVASLGEADW